jgi:hypothetical protein
MIETRSPADELEEDEAPATADSEVLPWFETRKKDMANQLPLDS